LLVLQVLEIQALLEQQVFLVLQVLEIQVLLEQQVFLVIPEQRVLSLELLVLRGLPE
jgi:hypothetical protein